MTYDIGEILTFTDAIAFLNFIGHYYPDQKYSLATMLGSEEIVVKGFVKLEAIETDKHRIPNCDNIFPPIPKDI